MSAVSHAAQGPSIAGTDGPAPPRVDPPLPGPAWPELLAPAGDWECARAAVENGADAIYFGLDRFNARMRARNFTEGDLPELMAFLHRRGVRGYVSFNILVFQHELEAAAEMLRTCMAAGVDAVIVQDFGLCRLIRQMSPDFPIHASTQMTITSVAGVEAARALGCHLVVLARECTVRDLEQIQASQRARAATPGGPGPLPLEVFIHGALCVAYSGQCLTSESLGQRSANRGECAQACRLPYELIADGQPVPLGDRRYLLSPQDLAGLPLVPDLVRAGIASFKIEGRLKSPNYVASITRIYRQALDALAAPGTPRPGASPARAAGRDAQYEMELAFSRGLFTGWLGGIDNQALVHGRFGTKRGAYLGEVQRVQGDRVVLRLEGPLKPGDGVVFDAGRPDLPEEGGRVYGLHPAPGPGPKPAGGGNEEGAVTGLSFGSGDVDFRRLRPGDKVWKTSDPALDRRLRQSYAGEAPRFQRPIDFEVHGRAGTPLTVIVRDELGHVVQVESALPLVPAERQPLTPERLREQLGRLGGTPFRLGTLRNELVGGVLLPVSELNRLRREAMARLEAARATAPRWTLHAAQPVTVPPVGPCEPAAPAAAALTVLVRTMPQLEATLRSGVGVARVYCEFEDPKRYREAVRRGREPWGTGDPRDRAGAGRPELFVAAPRITKPGEEWMLKQVRSSDADGYLVRTFDHLRFFAGDRRCGDYTFNVANALTAAWLIEEHRLEQVTASYDLNNVQLEALVRAAPARWFEVTLHQHMPMFHMEHCVFCAFLTQGTDYTNCGRPCDRQDLRLRDRVGAEHPVKADAGCRNTVFNATAQTGAEHVERLHALGVRRFRLEFLDESAADVERTLGLYDRLLRGEVTGAGLWQELKLHHQLGVTRGTLG